MTNGTQIYVLNIVCVRIREWVFACSSLLSLRILALWLEMCNCQKGQKICPVDARCLTSAVVYKATVTANDGDVRTYTGSTDRKLKERLYEHRTDRGHGGQGEGGQITAGMEARLLMCRSWCQSEEPWTWGNNCNWRLLQFLVKMISIAHYH